MDVFGPKLLELRDRLLGRGAPSIAPRPLSQLPESAALYERVLPFAEVMYLVMTADQEITATERRTLLGAVRSLTADQVTTLALERMLAGFESKQRELGRDECLDRLAAELYSEPGDGELALALAAAVAAADGRLGGAERATVLGLAELLGVSGERLSQLVGPASDQSAT